MTVRATRIEIYGFGKASGQRDNWKSLAVSCQRALNRCWQVWLCHHAQHGSAALLREHFARDKAWREAGSKGPRPKWPVDAMGAKIKTTLKTGKRKGEQAEQPLLMHSASPESLYRMLAAEFPELHARTRGLLLNAWQKKLMKRKSASGSLPGWVAILFALESVPSHTRPQPIPFDHANANAAPYRGDDKKIYLKLAVERMPDGASVNEVCELILNRRKTISQRRIIERIIDKEYAFKGSSLVFDRGKWFASIAYEMPAVERQGLDRNRILIVRPGRKSPWRITIVEPGGKWQQSWRFGGNGMHIENARRTIQRERASRKEHYRWAGSNQKGHGRLRAEAVWTRLSSRWKDFTKRYNNEISRTLIDFAIRRNVGRIIYCQPREERRDSRYLATAGNDGQSQMTWDYFQFGTMLSQKSEHEGIEYAEAETLKKSTTTKTTGQGVRNVRRAAGQPKRNGSAAKKAGGLSKV